MEKKEKEIVELDVTYKSGYYNYYRNEFEYKEKVLTAYSEYMRDFEDEDFDINNIDIYTDKDLKYWLDEYNIFYIDAYELSCKKENKCGVYDDINYYVTENIINDKRMYKLYSNIYDLNYQDEENVLISSEEWENIIQYIANEEDIIIEYDNECYYPQNNNDDDNE